MPLASKRNNRTLDENLETSRGCTVGVGNLWLEGNPVKNCSDPLYTVISNQCQMLLAISDICEAIQELRREVKAIRRSLRKASD